MTIDRRQHTRYSVRWRARISLPTKEVIEVQIEDISKGGVGICYKHALSKGSQVSVEFYVKYRGKAVRIRAKTKVMFTTILSGNRGAKLGLQFTAISGEHMHALNNVLHFLEEGGQHAV